MRTITHHSPGPLKLSADEQFMVVLDEIPSTGYQWRIKDLPDGCEVVRQIIDHPLPVSAPAPANVPIGGSVLREFYFVTRGRPQGRIILEHVRPWQEEVAEYFILELV